MNHDIYLEDIEKISMLSLPWEKFVNSSFFITGATGLIGRVIIDVLMYKNKKEKLNCNIYALGRSEEKAKKIFNQYNGNSNFEFICHDINLPLNLEVKNVDYVLHLASNTHPRAYSTDPIGTISANIIGAKNLLDFSVKHNARRFAFASSNEIYGENRGDTEFFKEDYCGYINSNTLRAGYPESKRCGEALCQAYKSQKNLDIIIPRFTRTFGPTMNLEDSKALSQFIKKSLSKQDIVLKSEGTQYYSYTYVFDAVSGLFTILLLGTSGEAYNIADASCDIRLKDLAEILAEIANTRIIYEIPDEIEKAGYSTATKARLSGEKLKKLGWKPMYDIKTSLIRTIKIMENINV